MKRGCLIAAGLGFLLAVPLIFFVVSRWTDIPPVDDSDLVLPARNIDPAQNPFPEIRSFELTEDAHESAGRAWNMIQGREEMDQSFIDNLLSIESETLGRFDRFSRMTDWQENQEITVDSDFPYLMNWLVIARLKAVETRQAIQTNQTDAAIESGVSLLRFAEALQGAEGGLIHQLVSATISGFGVEEVLRVVESGQLSSDQLETLSNLLSGFTFSPETFAQAYIVEYRTFVRVVEDLSTGKINIGQLQNSEETPSMAGNPPARFFFKKNETTKLLADAYREFIADSQMIRAEASGKPAADVLAIRENTGSLYFSGNLVGRILFSIVVPAVSTLNDTYAASMMSLELLRVRVALERYRMARGIWPEDLESLVPDFIGEIPTDLMDGQPLRYLKEKGVIYSVGVDFEDNGGIDPDHEGSLKSRDEIVIELRTGSGDGK